MRLIRVIVASVFVFALSHCVVADDANSSAILEKAIKAMGGADKLKVPKALSWQSKGKITFNGNENEFTSKTVVKGFDHLRQEFEGTFGGNAVKGVTVVAGDKGWRKFGEEPRPMEGEALANQKWILYLQLVPMTIVPLNDAGVKIENAGEGKVADKPVVGLKITRPDGKEFSIFFDKESGLPAKVVAKVTGRNNEEFTQETTLSKYKTFDGVPRATKIESKRNGENFIEQELSDFKSLDKVDPKEFAQPQ